MDAPQGTAIDRVAADLRAAAASSPRVLVSGNGEHVTLLSTVMAEGGYAVSRVRDGRAAIDRLRRSPIDLVLLDYALPDLDGAAVCRELRRDQATRLIPVMLLDCGSRKERFEGIAAGVDELISMPCDAREVIARARSLIRMKRHTDDLESATSVTETLTSMIESRRGYPDWHCHRIANYAAALARRLGLTREEVQVVRRGGFLHDIGMLVIPDDVVLKPEPLTKAERALVRSHTVIGESLLSNLHALEPVKTIVRHHHERRDGSGYPDGLQGDDIPLSAQIVAMVDVFEALTSRRAYQRARSHRQALEVLYRQTKSGWHRMDLFGEFAALTQAV